MTNPEKRPEKLMISTTLKPAGTEKFIRARERAIERNPNPKKRIKDATVMREVFNLGYPIYMGEPSGRDCPSVYVSIPTNEGKEIIVPYYEDGRTDLLAIKTPEGYIIARENEPLEEGSLVVASVKGEIIVGKHYTKEGVVVIIQETDADHPIISTPKTVKVYGVFHTAIKIKV